jgi:hypothetical protein
MSNWDNSEGGTGAQQWGATQIFLNPNDPSTLTTVYTDPNSGNVYNAPSASGQLVQSAADAQKIASDPYVSNISISGPDALKLIDLKNTDPTTYWNTVANGLENNIYQAYGSNSDYSQPLNLLESIKSQDPQAYYTNKLKFLGQQGGWQTGQNRGLGSDYQPQVQQLAQEAIAAGVSPQDVNSIFSNAYSQADLKNQQMIANNAANGGSGFNFGKDVLPGLEFVGAAAAAMTGLGAALDAGALGGAGALDSSSIAAGGSGGGGAFVPAGGSSFALPEAGSAAGGFGLNAGAPTVGAASPSGIMASQSAAGLGGSGTGIIEGLAPSSVGMGGTTGAGSLAGIAGSQAASGLGGSLLGTGLTADQLAQYEAGNASGLSASDIQNAKRLQNLAKLLSSGKSASQSIPATTAAQSLMSATQTPQQQFGGLYEMNKNPFTFTNPTAALLANGNKIPSGLDVSGQQGTTLNTAQQNQIYSSLLRS